jgi:primosomal replication protein N
LERAALRYTPAGLPALDVSIQHESELTEDGVQRRVSLEMRAVAIGSVTRALSTLALGAPMNLAGFLTHSRNGRGLLFHITSVEAIA